MRCINCGLTRIEHGIGKPAWCPNGKGQSFYQEKDMSNDYDTEQYGEKDRQRHGSPFFYQLLQEMAETHDKKSHDYASNNNPFGNYHFAGMLSKLFDNPNDAGFIGRLGEKYYRLANLENNQKEVAVKDEGIEDTERDIAVITLLWIVDRRQRRAQLPKVCHKCGHQQMFHG